MHRITKNIMKLRKPRRSMSRGLALFALGAAVGAGVAMWRDQRSGFQMLEEGDGPVKVDL